MNTFGNGRRLRFEILALAFGRTVRVGRAGSCALYMNHDRLEDEEWHFLRLQNNSGIQGSYIGNVVCHYNFHGSIVKPNASLVFPDH